MRPAAPRALHFEFFAVELLAVEAAASFFSVLDLLESDEAEAAGDFRHGVADDAYVLNESMFLEEFPQLFFLYGSVNIGNVQVVALVCLGVFRRGM